MPYRKVEFINSEIYHVVLRALDNNLIFKDKNDYYRGIFSIYEFNNSNPIEIRDRRNARKREKANGDRVSVADKRNKFVEVLAFCFMPNHIHLLLKQIKNDGITSFMKKVGIGYAGYFNRKYVRKGYVFQNRFLSVPIKNDDQLKTIFVYIHANPVSLAEPHWKELGVKDARNASNFLEDYKWSSYPDYINKKNFPSVTTREFISQFIGGVDGAKDFVNSWIKNKEEISKFPKILLE